MLRDWESMDARDREAVAGFWMAMSLVWWLSCVALLALAALIVVVLDAVSGPEVVTDLALLPPMIAGGHGFVSNMERARTAVSRLRPHAAGRGHAVAGVITGLGLWLGIAVGH